jgi:type VI secretion system secreted protein VgrG
VGKEGEEIWTDKYGRIKVQFHWDRKGEMNENSSCWIRVAQGWAGKQWGAMFLPRVGQEVLVTFMDGDPDRPLVTGSVYNSTQTVPYDLPDEQTKSTIKSNTTKEGDGFNEIRFDDLKENEEVFIHAQKDLSLKVLNNEVADVKNARYAFVKQGKDEEPAIDEGIQDMLVVVGNRKIEVKGDESEEIHTNEGKYTQEVTKTREITVKDNETHTNEKDYTQTVKGKYDLTVDGDYTQTVKGKCTLKVEGDLIIDVSGKVSIQAGLDLLAEAGGSLTNKAGTDLTNDAGKNLNNKAGMDLTNEGGMNVTNKASMDVTNEGLNVTNNAKVALNNKAVTLTNDASAMMENKAGAMLKLEGSAMVIISGGLVKIN